MLDGRYNDMDAGIRTRLIAYDELPPEARRGWPNDRDFTPPDPGPEALPWMRYRFRIVGTPVVGISQGPVTRVRCIAFVDLFCARGNRKTNNLLALGSGLVDWFLYTGTPLVWNTTSFSVDACSMEGPFEEEKWLHGQIVIHAVTNSL